MIQAIIAFFVALPEFIKLINKMKHEHEKSQDNIKLQAKVKQNLEAVNKAFEDKDAKIIADIING